ncbi:MAG: bifunctional (p)ppGpp synthetase/guanosine-3',5'-bis(diphosphate) 3'-pyrophosphohydrolase [Bacteroidales bacterium]|nr:bifunctional (p)ppGpp synthetase/guanosine-3',5'-bis(diphosphate) 3'-pyrophosphohydrolase [Bacteroidales bacterium]
MANVKEIFPHLEDAELDLVQKAYDIAEKALADKKRDSGAPFLEHPLGVAKIVDREIGLQPVCVAAVFLHEASRMAPESKPLLAGFPQEVLQIVDGLDKISTINPKDTRLEAENYKKLIVRYSEDPRVTVIKIADRLEIMRNLGSMPKGVRERKCLETLMLYIPLAHQLGLYNIKSEMEDIYFRQAYPEEYRTITNKLKATEKDREKLTAEFIEPLKRKLSDAGISYKLKIRTKTAWSIFKKMQKQKVPFEGVFDVFAIRFIVDCEPVREKELKLCWDVYSYVTEEYEPDTKRLRDWLTKPKDNGYECLHITVKNKEGAYLEVQIRSKRMDDVAENGDAAHWSYKGISHEATMDKWLSSVRYALEHPGQNPDDLPLPPSKEIFVFTPSGELRILSAGATVLDFAFNIHSNVGIKCTGALIGGKPVSIREKLQTGDVVEILTGRNSKPSADWLNFVVTSKARNKIRQVLKDQEYKLSADGKELLDRRLKNWKLELTDEMRGEFMKKHHFPSVKEMYAAIGEGTLDVNQFKTFIQEWGSGEPVPEASGKDKAQQWAATSGADDILVINAQSLKGLDYKMAKCCNPVFGDDVFGFVTRDSGIKIHRISCPNAARLMEMYPYRIQKVRWTETPSGSGFQVALKVVTSSEAGITGQIMDILGSFKTSLRSFNMTENPRDGLYYITIKVSVPTGAELDKVVSQIRNLRGVVKVSRV